MSYQAMFVALPARYHQRLLKRTTLTRVAGLHQAKYGNVVRVGNNTWAQLADTAIPDYLTWARGQLQVKQGVFCVELDQYGQPQGDNYLLVAWRDHEPLAHWQLSWLALSNVLAALAKLKDFQPQLFGYQPSPALTSLVNKHWPQRQLASYGPWLNAQVTRLPQLQRQRKAAVMALVGGICAASMWWFSGAQQATLNKPLAADKPLQITLQQQLTEAPGAAAPLFALDLQLQQRLAMVAGWQVQQTEFQNGELRYRLQRHGGLFSEIRQVAEQLHLQVVNHGDELWLRRSVQLPPALSKAAVANAVHGLVNFTHVLDHLDDSVALLIPHGLVQFQQQEVHGDWQLRQLLISLRGSSPDDLHILADMLRGLPVRLRELNYRTQQGMLHGYVAIDVYGETSL